MRQQSKPPLPAAKPSRKRYTVDHKLIASFGVVRGEMVDVRRVGDFYVAFHLKDDKRKSVGMFTDSTRAVEFAAKFAAHEIEVHRENDQRVRGHRT